MQPGDEKEETPSTTRTSTQEGGGGARVTRVSQGRHLQAQMQNGCENGGSHRRWGRDGGDAKRRGGMWRRNSGGGAAPAEMRIGGAGKDFWRRRRFRDASGAGERLGGRRGRACSQKTADSAVSGMQHTRPKIAARPQPANVAQITKQPMLCISGAGHMQPRKPNSP